MSACCSNAYVNSVLASAADPVAEEVSTANFKVITEVFEYSQDVVAVAIDAGAIVDGSSIDADTFTVSVDISILQMVRRHSMEKKSSPMHM